MEGESSSRVTQVEEDGGLGQSSSCGGGEEWSDSECVVRVETGFEFDVGSERRREDEDNCHVFGLNHGVLALEQNLFSLGHF